MEVNLIEKIPILKLKMIRTEKRILKILGNRNCIVYSESRDSFYKKGEWVKDKNSSDIRTLTEWHEEFKKKEMDDIVYYTVKI